MNKARNMLHTRHMKFFSPWKILLVGIIVLCMGGIIVSTVADISSISYNVMKYANYIARGFRL